MRKFCSLLVMVCLLHITAVNAQSAWLGLKGGLSIPNLSGGGGNPLSSNYTSRLAANFGLLSEFTLTHRFSLQAELNYAGQGGKRDGLQPITNLPPEYQQFVPPGSYLYANFDNKAVLDYLELPVMAKLTWGTPFQFYVNAGPYLGYLLHAAEKTSGNSQIYADSHGQQALPVPAQSFDGNTDVTSSIKRWNVGVTGGLGLAKPLGLRNRLFFDARFEYGFINIQKYSSDGKNNTGNVLLSIGYAYLICKK
ncbi:porin family protein [Puia dinghuensis]|nr:porin family protein [Puia dinghuensis]